MTIDVSTDQDTREAVEHLTPEDVETIRWVADHQVAGDARELIHRLLADRDKRGEEVEQLREAVARIIDPAIFRALESQAGFPPESTERYQRRCVSDAFAKADEIDRLYAARSQGPAPVRGGEGELKAWEHARAWHGICQTIATVLGLPEPEADFAQRVREHFDRLCPKHEPVPAGDVPEVWLWLIDVDGEKRIRRWQTTPFEGGVRYTRFEPRPSPEGLVEALKLCLPLLEYEIGVMISSYAPPSNPAVEGIDERGAYDHTKALIAARDASASALAAYPAKADGGK